MSQQLLISRLQHELVKIEKDPRPGIAVWPIDGQLTCLGASITGPEDSPYEGGLFKLQITIPNNYPFAPPVVVFTTPVYHPNIDAGGRICLDLLNLPPKGAWTPCIEIAIVLQSLQLLLASPNTKDPLMIDINKEYLDDQNLFLQKARRMTQQHAIETEHPEEPPKKRKKSEDVSNSESESSENSDDDSDEEEIIIPTTQIPDPEIAKHQGQLS